MPGDGGHGAQRDDVVDQRGAPEEPRHRRHRRLRPHLAALAFQALEQRRLLAADVRPGANEELDGEALQQAHRAGGGDGSLEGLGGERIFRAQVHDAGVRPRRPGGDEHPLDQAEWVALHDEPVGEGAGVALVGVHHDVLLRRWRLPHGAPLDVGGEAGAAAPAQAARLDVGQERGGGALEQRTERRGVVVERVAPAAALEDEPVLAGQAGQRIHRAQARGLQAIDARERAVGDAVDLGHGLGPSEAA